MSTTIESLQVELQSNSTSAVNGIDALASSLGKLKSAVKGGVGLTAVSKQITSLNTALSGLNTGNISKLAELGNSLSKLNNIKISSTIATQLQKLPQAIQGLNSANLPAFSSSIRELVSALSPLSNMGKNQLTGFITQLNKLPQLMQNLKKVDMRTLYNQIQSLTRVFKPLADEMQKVANGFSAFPMRIQRLITNNEKLRRSNSSLSSSYVNLAAKISITFLAVQRVARVIASWITESNAYIENLNLFTVSMGEFADESKKYAESVADIMGIDPSQWLRNQGIFMTLTTGFGVVSDRAFTMSQNLTQLGYDLSSFFNASYEDSFQKLQSGISGELEPLRRWGFDLSVARLQQEALNLGIEKSVNAMTQAEKAELRYYAIMTQVTTAQGDMARTLEAPANQLRILNAQVTQCARALGNIFIPVLNAVLPYAIALAKALRLVADVIANLFGFALPEIDYSSVGNMASGVGDVSDGLGDATEKAKELKNAMLGIDELNIISPSDNGSGGSSIPVGSGGLGFELPTYDFLGDAVNNKVNEILEGFKEWLGLTEEINTWSEFFHTKLGRILTTIGAIGIGMAAWKISKGVLSGIDSIMQLKKAGLDKPLMISVGVSLLAGSVTLLVDSIRDAIQLGLNEMNLAQMILSALGLTGGGAILGKALIKPMTVLSSTLTGSLIGGAIGAIGGVTLFFTGIWLAIKDGIDWLIASLITAGGALAGAGIGALIGSVGGPLGVAIGAVVGIVVSGIIAIVQNWESVSTWFKGVWKNIKNFFTSTIPSWWNSSVVPFFERIPTWFGELLESTRLWFVEKWNSIIAFLQGLPAKVGEVIDSIRDWFASLAGKISYALGFALGAVVQWVVDTYEYLKIKIPETIESVKNWFAELPNKIWNAIIGAKNKIVTWGTEMIETVKREVPKIIDSFINFFKEIPGKLFDLGKDIVDGFINGIKNWWDDVLNFGSNLIDDFVSGFKDGLDSHSPSRVFMKIGKDTILGYNIGLEKEGAYTKGIINKWSSSFTDVKPSIKLAVDTTALKYYNSDSFAKTVSANVATSSRMTVNDNLTKETLMEAVLEALNLSTVAEDVRRQADKNEQTVVQVGNRTITDAVNTQQKANGFKFVTT
ncbi:MAG: hypothetical protein ACK5L6_13535 [Anaerorhabdus sp.]|uniref:hypothetical protein n=1 Tax=Anaerorhabdus sp. TaxID=1872524 RepID=UPI003A8C61E2